MTETHRQGWISRWLFPSRTPQTESQSGEDDSRELLNNRGALFASGARMEADYVRAAECFKEAAEGGYAPAQNNLGKLFAAGQGVPRDDAEACRWFRRAAEQGDAGGQFSMGNLCHPASLGQLVTDAGEARIQAYMWFSLAAAQGYHKAAESCESLNVQMNKAELDESHRRVAAFVACIEGSPK